MKIFILLSASNGDSPRKNNSEENWKLLKNMTKIFYTLLSNRVIKVNYVLLYPHLFPHKFSISFAFRYQWNKRKVWKNTKKRGF